MTEQSQELPVPFDVVALLAALPAERLVVGQVGTVVETLDERTVLVEFADNQGRAYAMVPCQRFKLLVLHHKPQTT